MKLYSLFRSKIRHQKWISPESRLLVGVSGGVDSMVLLHLFWRLRSEISFKLACAHVNYRLRGEESDTAQSLVMNVCEAKKIPCFVLEDPPFHQESKNLQVAARNIRYHYFKKLCLEQAFHIVAVGHHQEDQVETVFERLLRGASLQGLAGIRQERALSSSISLIRPLLLFSKGTLEEYAKKEKIPCIEDSSNLSSKYWRNTIRKELIPTLKNLRPKSLDKIARFAKEMEEISEFLIGEATLWLSTYGKREEGCFWLSRRMWMKLPSPLRLTVFQQIFLSFEECGKEIKRDHWIRCEQIVFRSKQCGVYCLPNGFLFQRDGDDLMVHRRSQCAKELRLEEGCVSLKI